VPSSLLQVRLFTSIRYRAKKGWDRSWRVLIKAEHMTEGPNTRYAITNLAGSSAALYDDVYVQRPEACENSIKDLKNALKADRLRCHRFLANQFHLLLHAAAHMLMFALRRLAHVNIQPTGIRSRGPSPSPPTAPSPRGPPRPELPVRPRTARVRAGRRLVNGAHIPCSNPFSPLTSFTSAS
jgi:hypothetical protein